jgi:hypothetical protein
MCVCHEKVGGGGGFWAACIYFLIQNFAQNIRRSGGIASVAHKRARELWHPFCRMQRNTTTLTHSRLQKHTHTKILQEKG